jgi:redox-sensitive bicupin YhaK (pirin superfamily)
MIRLRPAASRGHANHGWLDTWHSFSFADYHDPAEMGWGPLRVINEDRIAPGRGFGTHGHRDMEIITWVLEGVLEHKDSLGNGAVIRPGELQRMSAGTGIMHSEFNPSPDAATHLLQIWIEPNRVGVTPGYEQKPLPATELRGRLRLVASPDGLEGSVTLHQDARVYVARLEAGEKPEHTLAPGRLAYVQVARGAIALDGLALEAGDGAKIAEESRLTLAATSPAEILLFDLPG